MKQILRVRRDPEAWVGVTIVIAVCVGYVLFLYYFNRE